jgi:hypothetical protein
MSKACTTCLRAAKLLMELLSLGDTENTNMEEPDENVKKNDKKQNQQNKKLQES